VRPTAPITTYASLWESLPDAEALAAQNALIGWSTDHVPFPGRTFVELVEEYIRGSAPLRYAIGRWDAAGAFGSLTLARRQRR
jgi:hypothetical protein